MQQWAIVNKASPLNQHACIMASCIIVQKAQASSTSNPPLACMMAWPSKNGTMCVKEKPASMTRPAPADAAGSVGVRLAMRRRLKDGAGATYSEAKPKSSNTT